MKAFLASLCFVFVFNASVPAVAQNSTGLSDGISFAETIKPTSPGSIVNPSGVDTSAWSSTTVPTSTPTSLGGFSSPTDGTAAYNDAQSIGLMGVGLQAQDDCATYVIGTDPLKDQECAAVNFLNNRCLPRSTEQSSVMGEATPAPSAGLSDCSGTFGEGIGNYGLFDSMSAADSIFQITTNALKNAATSLTDPGSCSMVTMITSPAEYDVNTCIKAMSANEEYCSLKLNASIETTYTAAIETDTCSTGVLDNGYCVSNTSESATPIYICAPGYTLSGTTCTKTTTNSAIPLYSCPPGTTLSGTNCVDPDGLITAATIVSYSCPPGSTLSGTSCITTSTTSATIASYSCPPGETLYGSTCQKTTTSTTTASTSYSCPPGQTLSGNSCVSTSSTSATPVYVCTSGTLSGTNCTQTASTIMTCPPPYTVPSSGGMTVTLVVNSTTYAGVGGYCNYVATGTTAIFGTLTAGPYVPALQPIPPASCSWTYPGPYCYSSVTVNPSLSNLLGQVCTYSTSTGGTFYGFTSCMTFQMHIRASLSCTTGFTISGNICTKTTSATVGSYSCPPGSTLSGTSCITTSTTSATITYSCTSGTLSGSTCIVTSTTYSSATPNYSCSPGYTLSGSNCVQTSTSSATPNYTCPPGTSLSGTNCVGETTTPATISSYSCPPGETLSGSNCIKTTTTSATLEGYSCDVGSILEGTTCITTTTTPATLEYSCVDGSTPINGGCIIKSVTTSWTDTCLPYETSAGSMLVPP